MNWFLFLPKPQMSPSWGPLVERWENPFFTELHPPGTISACTVIYIIYSTCCVMLSWICWDILHDEWKCSNQGRIKANRINPFFKQGRGGEQTGIFHVCNPRLRCEEEDQQFRLKQQIMGITRVMSDANIKVWVRGQRASHTLPHMYLYLCSAYIVLFAITGSQMERSHDSCSHPSLLRSLHRYTETNVHAQTLRNMDTRVMYTGVCIKYVIVFEVLVICKLYLELVGIATPIY